MTLKAILHGKISSEALNAGLEDVLTATVIGAISYGPPAMVQDWLARVAGTTGLQADVAFEFWPQHHLGDGTIREPDVFVTATGSSAAVVVEAKLSSEPSVAQLRDEAIAARTTHPAIGSLHLLTISDRAARPPSFRSLAARSPGLYATLRQVSWADLYVFLEGWSSRPECDAGHRQLIGDALAVLRKFGRDPFRGISREEVRAMTRDAGWLYSLPRELAKLHSLLSREVGLLKPPLVALDTGVRTDIVGGLSFSRPDGWLPRHFTLRYGTTADTDASRYYFVRAVLTRQEVWVGYAMRHSDVERLAGREAEAAQLVAGARQLHLVGVRSKGQPFEVLAEPTDVTAGALGEFAAARSVPRVNLVRVFPMSVLTRTGAERILGRELAHVVRLCRSVPSLEAP